MTVPDDVRPAPDADNGGQTREEETPSSAGYDSTPGAAADSHASAGGPAAPGEPAPTAEQDTAAEPFDEAAEQPPAIDSAVVVDDKDTEASGLPPADQWAEATAEAGSGQDDEPTAAESADPNSVSVSALAEVVAALMSLGSRVDGLAAGTAELARLRTRDTDLIARLHEDVTKLRSGEIAAALTPVVFGMIKLHDQMVSLGALTDPTSPVGMLYTQLLQTMELTCGVRPFTPASGELFDASRHTGTRRIPTTDASADGTIGGAIRAGFVRADGSVVRVAEVEVHRLSV